MVARIHKENQVPFDPIALEIKLESDFERSLESQEYSKNYQEELRASFEDGKYDGELDLEPEQYQWFDPMYRKGYLAGVVTRFNELFSA